MNDNEIKFPAYISVYGGKVIVVIGLLDDGYKVPFRDGKGYVKDGIVWVYKKEPPMDSECPYFWPAEHGYCFGKLREENKAVFSVEQLKPFGVEDMAKDIKPNEQYYNEEMLSEMNASTEIYHPEVDLDDDCLKLSVKNAILLKHVNLTARKHVMEKPYHLANLKTALSNKTKMSVPNLLNWTDILGLKFKIIFTDSGTDVVNPLCAVMEYDSAKDKISIYNSLQELVDDNERYVLPFKSNMTLDARKEEIVNKDDLRRKND